MKLEDFIKKHGNVNVDEKELKELLGIKDEKYFIPMDKEGYWSVNHIGDVKRYENSPKMADVFANNEIFRTKEEAEEHAKKQRFLLKMKRDFLDNSDDIDWTDGTQAKYNIVYDNRRNYIRIDFWVTSNYGILVTTNGEWLKEYIEKYEEEIKRYYFEIKEEKK